MNQKLNNTCIKCESVEHGEEIVKFYKDNGYDINGHWGDRENMYYGVFDMDFDFYSNPKNAKVLTLQEAKDLVKENQYPKVMWVSDRADLKDAVKRVVFAKKQNKFISWSNQETFEAAEKELNTTYWKYAKDIESEESDFETKTRERIAAIEKELEEIKKGLK